MVSKEWKPEEFLCWQLKDPVILDVWNDFLADWKAIHSMFPPWSYGLPKLCGDSWLLVVASICWLQQSTTLELGMNRFLSKYPPCLMEIEADLLKEPPSELVCRIVLASQTQSNKEEWEPVVESAWSGQVIYHEMQQVRKSERAAEQSFIHLRQMY